MPCFSRLRRLWWCIYRRAKTTGTCHRNYDDSETLATKIRGYSRVLTFHDFAAFNGEDYLGDDNVETYLRLGLQIPKKQKYLPFNAKYVPSEVSRAMTITVLLAIGIPPSYVYNIFHIGMKEMWSIVDSHLHYMKHFRIHQDFDIDALFASLNADLTTFRNSVVKKPWFNAYKKESQS